MVDRKTAHEKADALMAYLKEQGSVAIAFSGGVDSTLLLYLAKQALGDKTAAITASSPSFPAREAKEAADFCKEHGIRQIAFCCISTGVFRFPQRRAAQIAVRTVRETLDALGAQMRVVFNVFRDEDLRFYRELLCDGSGN